MSSDFPPHSHPFSIFLLSSQPLSISLSLPLTFSLFQFELFISVYGICSFPSLLSSPSHPSHLPFLALFICISSLLSSSLHPLYSPPPISPLSTPPPPPILLGMHAPLHKKVPVMRLQTGSTRCEGLCLDLNYTECSMNSNNHNSSKSSL